MIKIKSFSEYSPREQKKIKKKLASGSIKNPVFIAEYFGEVVGCINALQGVNSFTTIHNILNFGDLVDKFKVFSELLDKTVDWFKNTLQVENPDMYYEAEISNPAIAMLFKEHGATAYKNGISGTVYILR